MIIAVTKYTFIFSIVLIILGLVGYFKTDLVSVTALIPSFFGVAMLICAFLSMIPERTHMHVMHVTVMIAMLGFAGTVSAIPDSYRVLMESAEVARPEAAIYRAIMAVVCLVYLIIAVRWFISNRRKKIP